MGRSSVEGGERAFGMRAYSKRAFSRGQFGDLR